MAEISSFKNIFETVREDDFVEYFIFPDIDVNSSTIKEQLSSFESSVKSVIDKYRSSYIWQKDEVNILPRFDFGVPPIEDSGKQTSFCLGSACV